MLYLVASFNHWFPVTMAKKEQREPDPKAPRPAPGSGSFLQRLAQKINKSKLPPERAAPGAPSAAASKSFKAAPEKESRQIIDPQMKEQAKDNQSGAALGKAAEMGQSGIPNAQQLPHSPAAAGGMRGSMHASRPA